MNVSFVSLNKNTIELNGDLVYSTVLDVDGGAKKLFNEYSQSELLRIDLKDVVKVDSAGIALLVNWKRWCNSHDKEFQIDNIPKNANALILSYKLSSILDLN